MTDQMLQKILSPMKVGGLWYLNVQAPAEIVSVETQIMAISDILAADKPFTIHDIIAALRRHGVRNAAFRCADRLLQKLRKCGEIKFQNGAWVKVKHD